MSKPETVDFFSKEQSLHYDERNRKLAPIADNMHFLIRLALRAAVSAGSWIRP